MPVQTEKELPESARNLYLKARSAVELRNNGYAITLLQSVLKENPGFLDGRKLLRKVAILSTKGKKNFLSGMSTASMRGQSVIKKDPKAAMELAEKSLETDPTNPQINHLLKEAAKAAGFIEVAAFALETIVEANPKDSKTMHELGELYLLMNLPDQAVEIYSKIAEQNPSDLTAVKRSKDAAATASMKSGGWEQAQSYRDVMKNKEEAILIEQQGRVVRSADMIDEQLNEVYSRWEVAQTNVDLSLRMAKLWEDRFEQKQDAESLEAARSYYNHTNQLVSGSDPAVARKLGDLHLKQLDLQIKELTDWFAAGGEHHEDAATYHAELDSRILEKAELLIAEARKRVERNPTDLQLRFELGEQLVFAKHYTEAISELQKARQNPNARLRAMNLLGQCYTEKNMLDLAVKQFQDCANEIIAMDVTKKEVLYKLGLVFDRMSRKEESLTCMKEIYEADYGYLDVAQRVEQSYGQ